MGNKRIKITDLTLRDGHQSLLATRMRTDDILEMAPGMDKVGFYSLEVWGGATFDVPTRFLNEDPWERLAKIKKAAPGTPLQMLLRGQNLVGYRHYPDDVVKAFVKHAAKTGVDIFRVFDALNDERNFEPALSTIKESGKHAQLAISYSLTERKMGGPVYNLDYYIEKAVKFEQMGADSLCIKDMAGIISPDDAFALVKALKENIKIPVNLHSHYTSGMASMSFLKAIEAGVDMIDCCIAPFALRTSHPSVEPFVAALEGTEYDTGLDLNILFELGQKLETIAPKYRDFMDNTKMSSIDTAVLMHQVPGGMISNLVSQLREANALDRINEVYEELPRVRKELGYPPLVTPTSQIVGIQAVQNVLFGRYKVVSSQVKDYVYGLYGRPPKPVDAEVQKQVLKGYERGEEPISCRPADVLDPELEIAKAEVGELSQDIGDVLIYALYPTTGMRFLKWKYGKEAPPPETTGKTLEDIKREDDLVAKAKSGKLVEAGSAQAVSSEGYRRYNIYMGENVITIGVEPAEPGADPRQHIVAMPTVVKRNAPAAEAAPVEEAPAEDETGVLAPMPGIIIRYEVKEGDKIKAGENVVVLEAMKMAIDLPAPCDGTIRKLNFKGGDYVARDDVLAVIGS